MRSTFPFLSLIVVLLPLQAVGQIAEYRVRMADPQAENIGVEAQFDWGVDTDIKLIKGEKRPSKKIKCPNCSGTGGPAPWGASKAHRHTAATRYMVKMLLLDLWKAWREIEELPIRPPYAEEYLDKRHAG